MTETIAIEEGNYNEFIEKYGKTFGDIASLNVDEVEEVIKDFKKLYGNNEDIQRLIDSYMWPEDFLKTLLTKLDREKSVPIGEKNIKTILTKIPDFFEVFEDVEDVYLGFEALGDLISEKKFKEGETIEQFTNLANSLKEKGITNKNVIYRGFEILKNLIEKNLINEQVVKKISLLLGKIPGCDSSNKLDLEYSAFLFNISKKIKDDQFDLKSLDEIVEKIEKDHKINDGKLKELNKILEEKAERIEAATAKKPATTQTPAAVRPRGKLKVQTTILEEGPVARSSNSHVNRETYRKSEAEKKEPRGL